MTFIQVMLEALKKAAVGAVKATAQAYIADAIRTSFSWQRQKTKAFFGYG